MKKKIWPPENKLQLIVLSRTVAVDHRDALQVHDTDKVPLSFCLLQYFIERSCSIPKGQFYLLLVICLLVVTVCNKI